MADSDWYLEYCSVLKPERARLILIGVGSAVALVSVHTNTFLFIVLVRTRRHTTSPSVYLSALALADIFLSGAYLLIFLVNMLMDEFENVFLAVAWWSYMPWILCMSHLAITASAFLICAAAAERFVTISKIRKGFSKKQRLIIIACTFVIALIAKVPMIFEIEVIANLNCTGVTAWTAIVADFSESEPYKTVYKFWLRNIITVFLPFVLLFLLNLAIIRRLHRQHQTAKMFRFGTTTHKRNVRSATLLLICVTCTYLASNLLNVVVNIWEFIDRASLLTEHFRPFYTYSSDLVSFFTVSASALRLPIYYICNSRMRVEMQRTIFSLIACHQFFNLTSQNSNKPLSTVRYCQSGNGFIVYEARGSTRVSRTVGTRMDRIVLAVAMGSVGRAGGGFQPPPRRRSSDPSIE